jgi:hypothetical protein
VTRLPAPFTIPAGTSLRDAAYLIFRNAATGRPAAERLEIAREAARACVEGMASRFGTPASDADVEAFAQRILADNPIAH